MLRVRLLYIIYLFSMYKSGLIFIFRKRNIIYYCVHIYIYIYIYISLNFIIMLCIGNIGENA